MHNTLWADLKLHGRCSCRYYGHTGVNFDIL